MNSYSKLKQITRNTFFLYLRLAVNLIVGLYVSRIVLNALGNYSFGLYSAIGGVVAIFTILLNPLSDSTSRFLTYEIGRSNLNKVSVYFFNSLIIHFVVGIIIVFLAEIFGYLYIENLLNYDEAFKNSIYFVLHFSVASIFFKVILLPFRASIVSFEKLDFFSIISIIETLLKLVLCLLLFKIDDLRIVYYAFFIFLLTVFSFIANASYCFIFIRECSLKKPFDIRVIKEMLSFSGWNFIGTSTFVLNNHGINLTLNYFFGVSANTAFTISNQVGNSIKEFTTSILTAIRPQITKSYASGDNDYNKKLVFLGTRFFFFLMLFFIIPFQFFTEKILLLWLGTVPEYSVIFIQYLLSAILIGVYSRTIRTAIMATGKIKNYYLSTGFISILNIPISIFFYNLGFPIQTTFIVYIFLEIISLTVRLFFMHKLIKHLNFFEFIKTVFLRTLIVLLIILIGHTIIFLNFENLSLILELGISLFLNFLIILMFGFYKHEVQLLMNFIKQKLIFLK